MIKKIIPHSIFVCRHLVIKTYPLPPEIESVIYEKCQKGFELSLVYDIWVLFTVGLKVSREIVSQEDAKHGHRVEAMSWLLRDLRAISCHCKGGHLAAWWGSPDRDLKRDQRRLKSLQFTSHVIYLLLTFLRKKIYIFHRM